MRTTCLVVVFAGCASPADPAPRPGAEPDAPPEIGFTEEFRDHGPAEVDVLFVVDPAIAHGDEQVLVDLLPDLALPFHEDRPWRIGVTSLAPPTLGGEVIVLDTTTTEPSEFLALAVDQVLASARGPGRALDVVQAVPNFFREGSAISVILVSGPTPESSTATPEAFSAWVEELRPDWRLFAVHELAACEAARHAELVAATGGVSVERCADASVAALADELVLGEWSYALTRPPVEESLEVFYGDDRFVANIEYLSDDGGFTFEPAANSVALVSLRPTPGQVIAVSYEPVVE